MPQHDRPETALENEKRIERELRHLMERYAVKRLIDLPSKTLRQALLDFGEAGATSFNRMVTEVQNGELSDFELIEIWRSLQAAAQDTLSDRDEPAVAALVWFMLHHVERLTVLAELGLAENFK